MPPDRHEVSKPTRGNAGDRKRTRTPLACDICRERKVRCNGTKPICGRCQARGLTARQCVYSTTINPRRNDSQREYINILHNRIRDLEASHHSPDQAGDALRHSTMSDRNTSLSTNLQAVSEDPLEPSSDPGPQSPNFQINRNLNFKPSEPTSSMQNPIMRTSTIETPCLVPSSGVSILFEESHRESAARSPSILRCGADSATNSSNPMRSPSTADSEGQFNAMGVMCSMESQQQSPSQTFYGQSSVASLLNQIPLYSTRVEASRRRGDISQRGHVFQRRATYTPKTSTLSSMKRMRWCSLPPRSVADDLLDHYWSDVHLYYPWIHTQSFLKAYEAVWSPSRSKSQSGDRPRIGLGGSDCPDTVFSLALNAIFDLGCKFSASIQDQVEDPASEFMDKAFNLLHIELLDEPSLSLVQALVLVALYLQSTQQVMKCWSVAGLACRMAQGIGLHLSHHESKYSVVELEMRRRAWHGCMLLDRIVSMTLGRFPVLVGVPKVPLFSAIDDEYLRDTSESCFQPDGKFSRISFAVENVKLGWVLGDILQQLYGTQLEGNWGQKETQNKGHPEQTPPFDALVLLESTLSQFEANLPQELKWRDHDLLGLDVQLERPILRQKYVLRARLLHVRLMLYRPSFCKFCASAPSEVNFEQEPRSIVGKGKGIGRVFAFHSALACVYTASELVELLFNAVAEDLFGAWWYALYYLVSCNFILIMAEASARLHDEIGEAKFTELWRLCRQTLEVISLKYPMASQCAVALDTIRQRSIKIRQSASSKCRRQDEGVGLEASAYTQFHGNQPHQPSSDPERDLSLGWTMSPTQDAFAILNELDIEQINREAGGITPMFESLQNSFGSAIIPGDMWEALDMASNNGFMPCV